MPKINDKAAIERQLVTYNSTLIRMSADLSSETLRPEGIGTKYSVIKNKNL